MTKMLSYGDDKIVCDDSSPGKSVLSYYANTKLSDHQNDSRVID